MWLSQLYDTSNKVNPRSNSKQNIVWRGFCQANWFSNKGCIVFVLLDTNGSDNSIPMAYLTLDHQLQVDRVCVVRDARIQFNPVQVFYPRAWGPSSLSKGFSAW